MTGDTDVTVVRFSAGSRCAPDAEEDTKQRAAVMAGAVSVPQSVETFSNRLSKITALMSKSSLSLADCHAGTTGALTQLEQVTFAETQLSY